MRAEDEGKDRILLPHITYKKNVISIRAAALMGEKSVCFYCSLS